MSPPQPTHGTPAGEPGPDPVLTGTDRLALAAYWTGPTLLAFAVLPAASLLFAAPPTGPGPASDTTALHARLDRELAAGAASLTPEDLDAVAREHAHRSSDIDHFRVEAAGPDALRLRVGLLRRDGRRQVPIELVLRAGITDGWLHELEVRELRVNGWSLGPLLALIEPAEALNRELLDLRYKDQPLGRFLDHLESVDVDGRGAEIRLAPGGKELLDRWRALPDDHWEKPTGDGPRRPPTLDELRAQRARKGQAN